MDRDAHRRFLEYIEKYPYFQGPDTPRLTREEWQDFDAELRPMLPLLRAGKLSPEERSRARLLRKLLLVD